jgi:hypothetical protein
MDIKLELTQQETGFIIGVLAELPTKTGAWTLIQKMNEQIAPQIPTETKTEEKLNG